MFGLGPMEILILVVLGVLLFGKKLPDIGRSLGKTVTEFRKGVKGMEDDVDGGGRPLAPAVIEPGGAPQIRAPQRVAATAPKFEEVPANV